ncbi:MAG: hypothetical protein J5960_01455 [Desulfovibrio sp.]|nr:hypothetical protein [Desulfovibrio sp.]
MDKRRFTASCLLKLDGRAVRIQLSPAELYGGPEGVWRVRVNRRWHDGQDGNPLFLDRAGLAAFLADALGTVQQPPAPRPNVPADARVIVTVWQGEEPQTHHGWTFSEPIRACDGCWYVLVGADARRFFARCEDVRLAPKAQQPAGIRRKMQGR